MYPSQPESVKTKHSRDVGEFGERWLSTICVDALFGAGLRCSALFGAGLLTPPKRPTEGLLCEFQHEQRRADERPRVGQDEARKLRQYGFGIEPIAINATWLTANNSR